MADPDVLDRLFAGLAAADLPVPGLARVAARGRRRRRRARVLVVSAAAGAAALITLGVTQFPRTHQGAPVLRQRTPPAVCPAAPDAALNSELTHPLPVGSQQSISPIAVSPDHTVLYADTTAAGFHGIAAENATTGALARQIQSLPAAYNGAVGGLGPDGEVVWTSSDTTYTGAAPSPSPVMTWSPRTGQVTALEPAGQDGGALSAPVFLGPSNNLVAWAEGSGTQREIVEANLRTGTVDVLATGYVGPPVFVGNVLVWSVADGAGREPARLVARNAAQFPARQQTRVPAALLGVSPWVLSGGWGSGSPQLAVTLLASYGGATAYFSASSPSVASTELFYSPAPSQPARRVLQLSGGNSFGPGSLALGPGYLGWSLDSAASYLASTKSLAAVALTNGTTVYGEVLAAGDDAVVQRTRTPKAGTPDLFAVSGAVVAGLRCAPAGG